MFRRAVRWLANARAFTLAVLVHVAVIGILFVNLEWTKAQPKALSASVAIKTTAIDTSQIKQEIERQRQKELKKQQEAERQRREAAKEKQRLADQEKKRKAREAELKRQAEKKKKAEQQRLLAEKKKREQVEAKKKLVEEQKREQQEKERKLAEQKRQKELEAKRREQAAKEQRQKEMQAALEAEETASLIEHYASLINQYVQERWDVPPDATIHIGMSCQVSATLLPSGDILKLSVKVSSGNKSFDDSALKAVRRAEPLPLPPASENLFEEFRHITIPFVLKTKKT